MFKKLNFSGLNYKELDRLGQHNLKRDEMEAVFQTFDFLELVKKWGQIVGPKMSLVTAPLKLKNDSLFIITKHATYSHELSYLQEEIKGEIFKILPKLRPIIRKLIFQTQEAFFQYKDKIEEDKKSKNIKLHPQSPQFKILKLEAERLFSDIQDEELKTVIISIFIQSHIND